MFSKPLIISIYILAALALLLSVYNFYYANKVLPGIYVNSVSVSGLNKNDLTKYLDSTISKNRSIVISASTKEYSVSFDNIDLSYNNEKLADLLLNSGRDGLFTHFMYMPGLFTVIHNYDYMYTLDEKKLNIHLASFSADNFPKNKNASFYLQNNDLLISPSSQGNDLQAEKLRNDILQGLPKAQFSYSARFINFVPSIFAEDLELLKPNVSSFIQTPLQLEYGIKTFSPTQQVLLSMLSFEKENQVKIVPNIETISAYVQNIAQEINVDAKSSKLEVIDGKVVFEPPVVGEVLVEEKTVKDIQAYIQNFDFTSSDQSKILSLETSKTNPAADENDYGITELIAEGISYFVGSSNSRIANIVTASEKVSGTLVAPGENFSFNEAVGPITIEAGFNEAYVISKGRTVLGTGGGVCQSSTTIFRAALLAGFPIVERTAHAYRVSYYEQKSQIGWDATIYQPSVDFVFKNDTKHHILVYSEVDKENSVMRVKIYGTKDGRTVNVSDSKQVSQLPPPEARYIDTDKLPKGQVIQVEYPSWGGLVTFTREVKDKDGNVMYTDEFKNYYTPWAAVYERGV